MNGHTNVLKVRSSILTGFTEHCRRHQINPMTLLASENLTAAVLRSSDLQIPYQSFVRILNCAATTANYPLFPLTFSLRNGIEALGPLGLMASQCRSLRESLVIVEKYMDSYAQGVVLKLEQHGREARLVYDVHLELDIEPAQMLEVGIGRICSVVKALGAPGMPITGVSFRHAPLTDPDTYTELLGVEPQFNADCNSVSFPAPYLQLPPAPASERVRGYFESFLQQAGQNQARPLKQQVASLIHELIPTGEASTESVARLLGMHTRSLQRQLKLLDTDFRSLLEEIRYELAQDALRQPNIPLTDLALQLGYSELSSFSRAFKRWSGLSPLQWRENHVNPTTVEDH